MKKVFIRKFNDLSDKNWYCDSGDKICDSQMTFEGGWKHEDRIELNLNVSSNGGTYALNFYSKNIDIIENKLKDKNFEVVYIKEYIPENKYLPVKKFISKEDYLNQKKII